MPLALAIALPLALAVTLTSAPAFALTLTDTRAAISLLAGLLADGAFFVGLRRTTVSSAAAIGATLGQCGACGQ